MTASVIEIDDLNVWFDWGGVPRASHPVRGVDLSIAAGERVGLVGESGCGKSTTLLTIMGLLPSTATVQGSIRFGDTEILAAGEDGIREHRWRDIAMVFQGAMNSFNPVKTIISQIIEPMVSHGVADGRSATHRALELLERVGIDPGMGNRFPHEFSGGMKQRAAIAMALACKPRLLLADEPTTALDVIVQAEIANLLIDLTEQYAMSLLWVSHDLPMVGQVCSSLAVMYGGEIVERGPTEAVFDQPGHPYTAGLLAATPSIDSAATPKTIPGLPRSPLSVAGGCGFVDRCDRALAHCDRAAPDTHAAGPDQWARCHLHAGEVSS